MITVPLAIAFGAAAALLGAIVVWLALAGRLARGQEQLSAVRAQADRVPELEAKNRELELTVARLEKDVEGEAQKSAWLEQAEAKLREAFDALSSKALRGNADEFGKQANERLKTLVEPLGKGLEKLDQQVQALERRREGAYESMFKQVEGLTRANAELRDATTTLSSALRSTRARGKWGEVQLRRIAEMAGMADHVDFDEQAQSADGKRPDMVVRLPNEGIIPVDAKVPMDAYLDAQEAKDENELRTKLAAHAASIRKHMNELAKKAYWSQFERSPDFVVMLIPYESGLGAAFGADPALLDDAINNHVFIVSPVTLLALLKTTAMGWMQMELARNAQDIARQGKEVSDRFSVFFAHFNEIGSRLTGAVGAFNKAVGSAESRVLPAMRRLNEMGVSREAIPETNPVEASPRQLELEG